MNITVFAGAEPGNNPVYMKSAEALGVWMAENAHTLVYGAGKEGMMGMISDTILQSGGKVIGIIPKFMVDLGWQREDVTELIITENMSRRKDGLVEKADAFIALPGGAGTLEEVADVISWIRLGTVKKKCVLFNTDGFFDGLMAVYKRMMKEGFLEESGLDNILFSCDFDEIGDFLNTPVTE